MRRRKHELEALLTEVNVEEALRDTPEGTDSDEEPWDGLTDRSFESTTKSDQLTETVH